MDGGSKSRDNQESRPQYLQLRDVPETTDSSCDDLSTKLHKLPFQYLKEITNSFSDERVLRNGIFGVVYKGMLQNGEIIAVEKLVTSKPGFQKQFENECCHLMKLRHPNVVPFVGYCYETHKIFMESNGRAEKPIFVEMAERLLCSEYQPKGSLDKYLSDESSGFDWQERYRIIEGICYGLHYLQEQTDHQPIFLKPASIMLDDYTIPKITDFGISKFFHQQTKTLDSNATLSYMAPEYTHGGTITLKSDIFSLGAIILEIVTGQRGFPDVSRISSEDFIKLVDEKLKTTFEKAQSFTTSEEIDCDEIKRCIQIGLICVNPQKTKRPTTTRIIKMLHRLESTDCHFRNETETTSSLRVMSAMEAPMSSSLGAMGPLLSKLVSLLPPKHRVPKPLKEVIALLKEDLDEISTALLEQSIIHVPSSMTKLWMGEVRELSYDIEDFIDNIMQGYGVRPRFQRRKLRQMHAGADAKARYLQGYRVGNVKIAWAPQVPKLFAKITEFRTLLQQASEWYYRYLDGCTTSSRCVFAVHGQVLAPYGKAANYLVGIEETKTKLIELLTDEEHQQLKVVSIVGPAGVGKTTLAKQVYSELGRQFECRAFVRASRKPDMRRLLGGILSQVQWRSGPSDSCTVQDLIDNLAEYLQDKRYVIVVDDLWETTAWDILTSAFPDGNNRSRIITTAEIEGVALESCHYESNNILKMKPLGGKNSGKLFLNLVFGPEITCPEQLKEVSDIIISRCSGLPLAIVCVAGLLASQPDNSELWQHVQQSLCFSLSTDSSLEETLQEILKLSYNSTPHDLKTCLMYLGMYPEDRAIWKVDLVNQWITEGFINATEGEDAEEVAESYFGELVSRGLIQPVEVTDNGEVLSCTVNHVVLDLITEGSNEEKFITTLDYSQTITGLYGNARRLSLHFSNARYATKPKGLALSKIRSFAFFGIIKCMPSIVEFKLLRVVILEFWGDHQGSTSLDLTRICRLFQLRYLKISCDASKEVELPTQMQILRYLETLIIDATVSAVPFGTIHLPGSVRTLHYINSGSNSEDNTFSLSKLMNLQNLHITYNRKKSDEHLKENLAALNKDVDTLTGLPALTSLSLYIRQPTTRSIIFKRGAFPTLKNFKYTCDVLSLAFQEEAFPNLQRLELSFNAHKGEQYEHFVTGIEYMLNLKEIAGTIRAAAGAEEPDRRAAEYALNEAIRKHPRFPSYNIVSRADEGEWPHGKYVGKYIVNYHLEYVERGLPNGDFYTGQWRPGAPHGTGKYLWTDGCMYEGEWRHGKATGRGKLSWPSGATYEGEFKDGFMDGYGTYTSAAGDTYKGVWSMNLKHGYGGKSYANGDQYGGEWRSGLQDGAGRYIWCNGTEYTGEWRAGLMNGRGALTWTNGNRYGGGWEDGCPHGQGTFRWADGSVYVGFWTRDGPNGIVQQKGVYCPSPAAAAPMARDPRDVFARELPGFMAGGGSGSMPLQSPVFNVRSCSSSDREYEKIHNCEPDGDITCDIVDGAALVDDARRSMRTEDGTEGGTILQPPSPAPRITEWVSPPQAKQQGETIIKGHKHYELMLNLQLGIRHSVGNQGPVTLDLKSGAFNPKEKLRTKFPQEGSKHTPRHNSFDFVWKDYCPQVFRTLRKLFKVNAADYMLSLCGSEALRKLSFPGKSGSFFYLTNDDQYMIKAMKKSEVKMLLKMLRAYYNHVRSFEDTLLTKFFGLHCVKLAGANQKKVRFVIMGNVCCSDNSIHRRFDLKGSSLGRTTDKSQTEIDQYTILKDLDLNFIFRLKRQWFQEFQRQVDRDCDFLEQERIMDYSLLVGVHFRHNAEKLPTEGCSDNPVSTPRLSKGYTDQFLPDLNRLPKIKHGTIMPARAELTTRNIDRELQLIGEQLIGEPTGEYHDVILHFGIIDILQGADMSKRIEHAYKSLQYDPALMSEVEPMRYSRRFKDFIYKAFQEDS